MLQLINVNKYYGNFLALKNINLTFKNKGFVSIVGPSGSGKSTLLNIIGGLDTIEEGKILLNGHNLVEMSENNLNKYRNINIGFVFQDFNLIKHLTVIENVMLASLIGGKQKKFVENKARNLLEKLGLLEKIEKYPNQLSGGEKQRVAIARALINDPKIILADEPTGNLDSSNSIHIFEILKELSKEKLVIVVTHNEELAKKYTNEVIRINDGEIKNVSPLEMYNYDKQEDLINTQKVSLKLNTANMLVKKNLLSKKFRLIPILFAIIITLTGIGLSLGIQNGSNHQIQSMNNSFLETDLLKIKKNLNGTLDYYLISNLPIYNDDINQLKQINNISQITNEYNYQLDFKYDDKKSYKIDYMQYINNDFFNDRIKYGEIIGKLPNNKNEIVISETLVKYFFGEDAKNEDAISSVITLIEPINNIEYQLKIVGINTLKNVDGKIINYLPLDLLQEISQRKIDLNSTFEFVSDRCYTYIPPNSFTGVCRGKGNYSTLDKLNSNIEDYLIYGRVPSNDNEIIVSSHIFYNTKKLFTDDNFEYSELINKSIGEDIINNYLNKDISIIANDIYPNIKVVGIYNEEALINSEQNNENFPYNSNIFIRNGLQQKLKTYYPTEIYIYMDNNKHSKTIISTLEKEGYEVNYPYQHFVEGMGYRMTNIQTLFVIISIMSLIISIVLIYSMMMTSVVERTNEIGILRAIGTRRKDVLLIFNIEASYLGVCSSIIAIIFTYVINIYGNNVLKGMNNFMGKFIETSWEHYVLLLFIGIFISIIGSIIPAYKASKLNPIDAIRR